jgi:hypothetical protein
MRAALVQHLRARPTPRVAFGSLHETLIIASVATVLVIRTQLGLTRYAQLGRHGLHIAHLLWGGLFMLLAIGLLLVKDRAAHVDAVPAPRGVAPPLRPISAGP